MRLPGFLAPWFGRPPASIVRPLGADAAPALAPLHAGAFARGWSVLEFQQLLSARGTVCDGLMRGARPVGFALSRVAADEAELLTIVLAPSERGRGGGGRLLDAHLRRLVLAGAKSLFLEVEEANSPALALYRRRGFREVGRREAYYRGANGRTASALVLRRDLV